MWALTITRRLRAGFCCEKRGRKDFSLGEEVPGEGGYKPISKFK